MMTAVPLMLVIVTVDRADQLLRFAEGFDVRGFNANFGTDGRAVGDGADVLDLQPCVVIAPVLIKSVWHISNMTSASREEYVKEAVVIKISPDTSRASSQVCGDRAVGDARKQRWLYNGQCRHLAGRAPRVDPN